MEITIIIGLVFFALSIFLVFKFIKNVAVAILTALTISVLLVAGVGFFVFDEVQEMQERFPTSNNLVLLRDGDTVMTGLVLLPAEEMDLMEQMKFLDRTSIDELTSKLSAGEMDKMFTVVETSSYLPEDMLQRRGYSEDTYKIIFVDYSVLKDSPVTELDVSRITDASGSDTIIKPIPQEDVLKLLKAADPWEELFPYVNLRGDALDTLDTDELEERFDGMNFTIVETPEDAMKREILDQIRGQLEEQFGTDDIKGLLFLLEMAAIFNHNDTEGMLYIFEKYQGEEIAVQNQSIIFDLARLSPTSLIEAVVSETGNAANDIKAKVDDYQDSSDDAVADPDVEAVQVVMENGTQNDTDNGSMDADGMS
ncbi:MAG: hypothetical protein ACOC32_03755 [Nanoarchaeota archaeon]